MKPSTAVSALTGLLLVLTTFLFVTPEKAEAKKVAVYSRTFLRPDKSKTISIRDDNKMRKELRTYNHRGVLIWKGIYRLDKYGRHRSAEIFDAQNKLLFKAAYGFDNRGRLRQERFYSSKNQLLRYIDYPYDKYGKRLKAIARNRNNDIEKGYASTHPDSLGVKQATAAKKAGRRAAPASRSTAGSSKSGTRNYGAPSSSARRSSKSSTTRRSTVNTNRSGSSSLRVPSSGSSSRYRNR